MDSGSVRRTSVGSNRTENDIRSVQMARIKVAIKEYPTNRLGLGATHRLLQHRPESERPPDSLPNGRAASLGEANVLGRRDRIGARRDEEVVQVLAHAHGGRTRIFQRQTLIHDPGEFVREPGEISAGVARFPRLSANQLHEDVMMNYRASLEVGDQVRHFHCVFHSAP